MNNFKYTPKGRDISITMDGDILIDSNPKIQALVTLINEKDPEALSFGTRGRIAVEMQNALYDTLDKYSIRELARNHIENLLKENPKIKSDEREREKALRSIKSGVLAPYSEELEKQFKEILENDMVNEANFSIKHYTTANKMNFSFVPYGGVDFYLTSTNMVSLSFDQEEQGKLYMLTAYDKSFEKDILDALPDLLNDVIKDIPNYINIDREITRVVKELLARKDEDEIKNWKNNVPYSSLVYYIDRINAEIKRHGYDVSERSRFRDLQKARFYEKYGHKIKNPRIYEAGGKGKHGKYDISIIYGYKPGDFSINIGGLVNYKIQVDAEEEANLILVNKDTFGEKFSDRLYDYIYAYFKDKLRRTNTNLVIKKYVDYLFKYEKGLNIERSMNIFVKDLYAFSTDPLYLYKDEIKAEIEKRGINLELNESAVFNRESHKG